MKYAKKKGRDIYKLNSISKKTRGNHDMSKDIQQKESKQLAPEFRFIIILIRFLTSLIPLGIMNTEYIGATLLVLLIMSLCDSLENFLEKNKIEGNIPQEKRENRYAKILKNWIKTLSIISVSTCILGLAIMVFKMGQIDNIHYELVLTTVPNICRLFSNLVFLVVMMWAKNK